MFKNGELVVKNGKVVKVVQGATHVVRPDYDKSIEKPLNDYFDRYLTVRMDNFKLADEEIVNGDKRRHHRAADRGARVVTPACRLPSAKKGVRYHLTFIPTRPAELTRLPC